MHHHRMLYMKILVSKSVDMLSTITLGAVTSNVESPTFNSIPVLVLVAISAEFLSLLHPKVPVTS